MPKLSRPLRHLRMACAMLSVSGCTGIVGYEIVWTDVEGNAANKVALAECPQGKAPITGGYRISDGAGAGQGNSYQIMVNGPEPASASGTPTHWVTHVRGIDASGGPAGDWTLTAYAACADVRRD